MCQVCRIFGKLFTSLISSRFFSFIPAEGDSSRSNMAVMEIYLPSGFVVDTDTLPTLESSERIKVNSVFNN